MDELCPSVGALLTEDGVIAERGGYEDLKALAPKAQGVDLRGRCLMPAFLDAHGHFLAYAFALAQPNLLGCRSKAEIKERIEAFIKERGVLAGEWITARNFEPDRIADGRVDREFLDSISGNRPLVLQNRSGHAGVFGSEALRRLNITAASPEIEGGKRGRSESGELNGLLEEKAFIEAVKRIPAETGKLSSLIRTARRKYLSNGIVLAQEGMLTAEAAPLYCEMQASGMPDIELVAYLDYKDAGALKALFSRRTSKFRIGGIKIFLDGSPQDRTAWMRRESAYLDGSVGYGVMKPEEVLAALEYSARHRVQLLAHCNGDAAAEQFITAVETVNRRYKHFKALRPVMIHAQFLGKDQLARVKREGIIPSFFIAHAYHFGDAHIENLGYDRAALLSPAGSALRLGIPFTFHQDAPVVEPDMLETVWCAANRLSEKGVVLGQEQAVPVWEALKAVTINAAYQYFMERERGSLNCGKREDLVVLSENPLKKPKERIKEIRVLKTIKDGETLFEA